jgi:glutamine synthetase
MFSPITERRRSPKTILAGSPDTLVGSWSFNNLASSLPKDEEEVKWIRAGFCNINNLTLSWAIPPSRLTKAITSGLPHPMASFASPFMFDSVVPEARYSTGEVIFMPDDSTMKKLLQKGHAMILGDFHKMDGGVKTPFECCPRGLLKKQLVKLEKHGLKPMIGFELEFILYTGWTQDGVPIPLDSYSYMDDRSFLSPGGRCVEEIVDQLTDMGIEVFTWHAEATRGQYEISLAPGDAIVKCDEIVFVRSIIRAAAMKHSLQVTFAPKVWMDEAGNGAHLHMSLLSKGENVLPGRHGLSDIGQHFLAGVLKHLESIVFLTLPIANSYNRLQAGSWAGGIFTTWGYENREAACRVASPPYGGHCSNIEFRLNDNAANPYISVAAYLAAGMTGLDDELVLQNDLKGDVSELTDVERMNMNARRLPKSLEEACSHFEKDLVLQRALGTEFSKVYKEIKSFEARYFAALSDKEALKMVLDKI